MSLEKKVTNILHITDLHFKVERSYNQKIVLDALLADIASQSEMYGEPDLIVFSGDLVHNADDPNVYDRLYDIFIEDLLKTTNCDHSRFYVSPGNHDLQRSKIQEFQELHVQIENGANNRDELNEKYLAGELFHLAREKCENFYSFQEFFDSEGELLNNEIVQVYDLPGNNISLVCLNTAWMGMGGMKGANDLGKLLLPEAALHQAFEKIPNDRFLIAVHHHPTNWLAEFSETDFKDLASRSIDLQLVGHVHDPRPIVFRDAAGQVFQNQSGALYTGRNDRYLGYSLLRIEPNFKHIEVCWRSYYDRRRQFDDATNINENGGWLYSSEEAQSYFERLLDPKQLEAALLWRGTKVLEHFQKEFESGLIDRPTSEVFVAPPLSIQVFKPGKKEEETDEFVEIELDYSDLKTGDENIIIRAHPEHGRTTLLQQICLDTCKKSNDQRSARHYLPVFLSFSDFVPGTKRVEKAIRDNLPDFPNECKLDSMLAAGAFVVCIDDVQFSDAKKMKELREFVSAYKLNRFILSTQISREHNGLQIDTTLPAHFEQITLREFRRKDVRALVKKWDDPNGLEEETLNKVVNELQAINVPRTPINSSLLLDIISNDNSFSPLNRPAMIERFIETLLKKRSISEIQRKKFDFTNQVHYLGHVAEYMCRENSYVLRYEELFQLTDRYLKGLGLNFGARDIIENSIASRVMIDRRSDNRVSFRFRAFLEFFVASQMKNNVSFKAWVLEENRFLSYLNELEYYAGLERQDLDLLKLVGDRHDKYTRESFGDKFSEVLDGGIEGYLPSSMEENLKYADDLAEELQETPLTEDERDEILDGEIPQDAEGRQEVFRPAQKDAQSRYILSLVLYTTLVKNTELIPDADKREHLNRVLRSWAYTVLGSYLVIPSLVKNRRMVINGLSYVISYPKEYSDDRVAKLISVNTPKEIGRMIHLLIGTEKLEMQLTETTLDEVNQPKMIEYFKSALCIDLRLKEWWKVPGKFNEKVKDSHYFQEVMLSKAADVYRLGGFTKPIETELQNQIVESFAQLYSPSREKIQNLRNKKKASMERARNLHALKAKIAGDN